MKIILHGNMNTRRNFIMTQNTVFLLITKKKYLKLNFCVPGGNIKSEME